MSRRLVLLGQVTFSFGSLPEGHKASSSGDRASRSHALHCSLREAINAANQSSAADAIVFDIPPGGVQTITPTSSLPAISFPVTIDGTTQPGFSGTPIIELDGSVDGPNGLLLNFVTGTTVRGLVINRYRDAFDSGIRIEGGSGNVIEGNFIGTDPTGTLARPNQVGITVRNSQSNRIGGTTAAARNLVSGNFSHGVFIDGGGGNVIQGNYVGTDASGSSALGQNRGILVVNSPNTSIGGTAAGAGNLVSMGPVATEGIRVEGACSTGAVVQGNFVGTDATGTAAVGNAIGVLVIDAPGALLGGTAAGARNLVSGTAPASICSAPSPGLQRSGRSCGGTWSARTSAEPSRCRTGSGDRPGHREHGRGHDAPGPQRHLG